MNSCSYLDLIIFKTILIEETQMADARNEGQSFQKLEIKTEIIK